jgi:two-component system, chemotaxis family, chemotaxis protein CheY
LQPRAEICGKNSALVLAVMCEHRRGDTIAWMASTVLVVDDHAEFRLAARMLLEAGGYQVIGEAACGAEALAVAAAERPEIVLLDVQLPDMDGFTVSRELLQVVPFAIVVLCSVREASDYGARIDGCGARGFLTKSALSAESFTRLVVSG